MAIARKHVPHTCYLRGSFDLQEVQLVSMSFVLDMDSMHYKRTQSWEICLSLLVDLVRSELLFDWSGG